jgi:ATPase subunit of ABC transporter with duplicated ATPase domains
VLFRSALLGELKPNAGKVVWGHEAQIGYMPQDVKPIIPANTTCFDYLHDIDASAGNEQLRGLLGRMLFRGDEGLKPTKALSGGEAVRLLFCKLMLTQPNILVLDEPNSHLDLESISALAEGLQNYPGTVFMVAHDRDLIASTATRIFAFHHGGVEDFAGDYDAFLAKHGGFIEAQ